MGLSLLGTMLVANLLPLLIMLRAYHTNSATDATLRRRDAAGCIACDGGSERMKRSRQVRGTPVHPGEDEFGLSFGQHSILSCAEAFRGLLTLPALFNASAEEGGSVTGETSAEWGNSWASVLSMF